VANGVLIEGAANDTTLDGLSIAPSIVEVRSGSQNNIYVFFAQATTLDLVYRKSTDGGQTWGSPVAIDTGDDWATVAVWYDRWTPGDNTGNLIHIAACGNSNDKCVYFSLDASSDTAGSNNDVDIISWTDLTPSPDGCVSICKAANGDLYAGAIGGSGPIGIQVARSTNSGSSWTDISSPGSGTDIQAELDSDADAFQLLPLSTDNDILLIGMDDSSSSLDSYVFDAVAGTWGAAVNINPNNEGQGTIKQVFGATVDKSTGNVYAVYRDGPYVATSRNVFFNIFSDSTRTWGTERTILDKSKLVLYQRVVSGICICRDETNGILLVGMLLEIAGVNSCGVHLKMSSDDGVNWSDLYMVRIDSQNYDDFRKMSMPLVMVDTNEVWYPIIYNDDNEDIVAAHGGFEYKTFSGTVYDEDGTTPVQDADVKVFRAGFFLGAETNGGNEAFQGQAKSDASGNYLVGVLGNQTDDTEDEHYFAVAYKQGGTDADDQVDCSLEDTSD
jgi:hypothetical protein